MDNVFQDANLQKKFKKFEAGNRNIKIGALQMKTKLILDKKVGVVIDGRIYPIIKGRNTSWSFLQSSTTPKNKEIFRAVVQAIAKAKTKQEKEIAYIKTLEAFDIPQEVSAFALRVADSVKVV